MVLVIKECFGSLIEEIAIVTAEKKRLYLRIYSIDTTVEKVVVIFSFRHAAMLFSYS